MKEADAIVLDHLKPPTDREHSGKAAPNSKLQALGGGSHLGLIPKRARSIDFDVRGSPKPKLESLVKMYGNKRGENQSESSCLLKQNMSNSRGMKYKPATASQQKLSVKESGLYLHVHSEREAARSFNSEEEGAGLHGPHTHKKEKKAESRENSK